jgi:hypothetical protein
MKCSFHSCRESANVAVCSERDLASATQQHIRAFNAIYGEIGRSASEEVTMSLIKSKCIPCLPYGSDACHINNAGGHSLDFTCKKDSVQDFSHIIATNNSWLSNIVQCPCICSWTDMPHQKIAFVVPFVMLHSPNCAQLFIHTDLCGVYIYVYITLWHWFEHRLQSHSIVFHYTHKL